MISKQIKVTIGHRLWLRVYVKALVFMCEVFGTEPDYDKLCKMIIRGTYIK
jgi:hypothetical protein